MPSASKWRPYNVVAELTYRCPLRCTYCSNPLDYAAVRQSLDGSEWIEILQQAAELGVVHVGLSGGEPSLHPDLPAIVAGASNAKLFVHLVTAGTTLERAEIARLAKSGLRSVQLSIQGANADVSDAIAGVTAFEKKCEFARDVRSLDLPLTLNVVLHRENLHQIEALVALATSLGANRLELANTQYYGWALRNRSALLPTREQLEIASQAVKRARRAHPELEILFVLPDYFSDRPKPCMGGWGRKSAVVAPDGQVLPCHAAAQLPNLEFWRFPERDFAMCWNDAPGMQAYRGEGWMPEPCRSCPERAKDFGGCRCQAFALTSDASATDPACALSPDHALIEDARRDLQADAVYRGTHG